MQLTARHAITAESFTALWNRVETCRSNARAEGQRSQRMRWTGRKSEPWRGIDVELLVDGQIIKGRAVAALGRWGHVEKFGCTEYAVVERTGLRVQVKGTGAGGTVNLDAQGCATAAGDRPSLALAEALNEAEIAHDTAQRVAAAKDTLDGLSDAQLGRVLRSTFSDSRLAELLASEVAVKAHQQAQPAA